MNTFNIEYRITLPDKTTVTYKLLFDAVNIQLIHNVPESLPDWTRLEFNQCSICPLKNQNTTYCPLAANLVNIINHFDGLMSYENVFLEVVTDQRTISKETTVQDGLSAMMGLVIPTSGCPQTAYFKPMARFHLPLADTAETIYRATSMYLMSQYFCKKTGEKIDFDFSGLTEIYKNMQIMNAAIADRIRAASKTDSSVNALILLDMFAMALPIAIEESLEELRYLFSRYLEDL